MNIEDKRIKELSLRYGKDKRIIQSIAHFPIKFTKRVMADPSDNRPVRIRYFGAFIQKELYTKATKRNDRLKAMLKPENIESVFIVMVSVMGFPTSSIDGAINILKSAEETKDYEKIEEIYSTWLSFRKGRL
jgi:hypothetical protein